MEAVRCEPSIRIDLLTVISRPLPFRISKLSVIGMPSSGISAIPSVASDGMATPWEWTYWTPEGSLSSRISFSFWTPATS